MSVDVLPPGRCYAVYWLMLANCCFSYGGCCCHSFCGRCYCHCYVFLWQMLLPFFLWQMLLPLLCILLADVIILLLADVIAKVCVLFGWWQMLLPLWLLFLPLVGRLYHFRGRCYCHLCWQSSINTIKIASWNTWTTSIQVSNLPVKKQDLVEPSLPGYPDHT